MKRMINANKLNDNVILSTYSRTPDGLWVGDGPVIMTPWNTRDDFIGELVVLMLSYSGETEQPESWNALLHPLLQLAGQKAWNAFARRASSARVEQQLSSYKVTPDRRTEDMAFVPEEDLAVALPIDCDEEELGRALLVALDR